MAGKESLHVDQWEAYGDEVTVSESGVAELKAILKYMDEKGVPTLTASTAIMIAPGFRWRIVDAIVTNFHQPQSTLLLLVSSFLGRKDAKDGERWREIYNDALANGYRFLSYGDACLLL